MSAIPHTQELNLHALLRVIVLFDVLKKPINVVDFAHFINCDNGNIYPVTDSLKILESLQVIEKKQHSYVLYGRDFEQETTSTKQRLFEFILGNYSWVEGAVRLPSLGTDRVVYLYKGKKSKTNLANFILKKLFKWFDFEALELTKNNLIYQEEILTALIFKTATPIKSKKFKHELIRDNYWIEKQILKYTQEPFIQIPAGEIHVKKVRRTDTPFSSYLIRTKLKLDFDMELIQRLEFVRQWILPKISSKAITNRII